MMRNLNTKFALTTISIMLASSILAFMMANFYYQQKLKPENDQKNTVIAEEMVNFIEKNDTIALDDYLNHLATIGYQVYLVSDDEKAFYGDAFREENLSDAVIKSVLQGETYHGMANLEQETFVTGFFSNELKNTIGVPFTYQNKQYALFMRPNIKLLFNEIHILLAWLLAGMLILSIIFVLIATRFLVKPITRLEKATEQIAQGDFNVDLDIERNDEIGKLSKSFQHMAEQLSKLDEMKSDFIGNISHDIQTPLSTIKGYTELLRKASISNEEKERYIAIIHEEVSRLSALTKQLLVLASIDKQEQALVKKPFALDKQIRTLVMRQQFDIEEKALMISLQLDEVNIVADETLLYNVWENLLTNAIKYNKENGTIEIRLKQKDNHIEVIFIDTGIGMTEEEISNVFERFYRADKARTRGIQGSGLGLSIVQTVIALHHGKIQIQAHEDEGVQVKVILPN